MRKTRPMLGVALAGAAIVLLAGCAAPGAGPDGGSTAPTAAPATSTEEASADGSEGATDPEPACSGLTPQEAYEGSVDEVPPPFDDMDTEWFAPDIGLELFDDCAALSPIVITIDGGTASSPSQIMLFHHGEYVGTATETAYGFWPEAVQLDEATVEVTYRYPQGDDTNADPSGRAVATFAWNAETEQVDMTGELPPGLGA